MSTRALILRTAGTNCDVETAEALTRAGAIVEKAHIQELIQHPERLKSVQLLAIPGGFSYGDDVGAGKILANQLRFQLTEALNEFVLRGKIVIGICNGFQVLVKAGLLPGDAQEQTATLAHNDSNRFQCHWTTLKREKSACAWLNQTDTQWELPIAHGEGKFVLKDSATLRQLEKNGQVVFRYAPTNPNGSTKAIAGICNPAGNVVGLMPHPERHMERTQHPMWTHRHELKGDPVGLQFFKAAVQYAEKFTS